MALLAGAHELMVADFQVGQKLALVVHWTAGAGEAQRGLFFGSIAETPAGLALSRPGLDLLLPSGWSSLIRRVPAELNEMLEGAPFMLEYQLNDAPRGFRPADLVAQGF